MVAEQSAVAPMVEMDAKEWKIFCELISAFPLFPTAACSGRRKLLHAGRGGAELGARGAHILPAIRSGRYA